MVKVDLRTKVFEVPTQDVISRDNVSVKVSAVVYLRVIDAEKAIIQVEKYLNATSQLAQTTLRSVLGKHELDDMLAGREKLNLDIQQALDAQTNSWGIKVSNVEIKQVDLTESMITGHRASGGGRARAARQGDPRRGRAAGFGKAVPGRQGPGAGAAGDSVALPGNADRDRRGQEYDHRLSAADGRPDSLRATQASRLELIVRRLELRSLGPRARRSPADRRSRGVAPRGAASRRVPAGNLKRSKRALPGAEPDDIALRKVLVHRIRETDAKRVRIAASAGCLARSSPRGSRRLRESPPSSDHRAGAGHRVCARRPFAAIGFSGPRVLALLVFTDFGGTGLGGPFERVHIGAVDESQPDRRRSVARQAEDVRMEDVAALELAVRDRLPARFLGPERGPLLEDRTIRHVQGHVQRAADDTAIAGDCGQETRAAEICRPGGLVPDPERRLERAVYAGDLLTLSDTPDTSTYGMCVKVDAARDDVDAGELTRPVLRDDPTS